MKLWAVTGRRNFFTKQRPGQQAVSSPNTYSSEEKKPVESSSFRAQKISRAMKTYLEKAKQHRKFMQKEKEEFELGKRHLANIMSLDPDAMTQEDINKYTAWIHYFAC